MVFSLGYERHVSHEHEDKHLEEAKDENKSQDNRDSRPAPDEGKESNGKPTGQRQAAANRAIDPPA